MLLPASYMCVHSCTCVFTFHFKIRIASEEVAKAVPSGFLDPQPVSSNDCIWHNHGFQETDTTASCAIHSATCTGACGHHVSQHAELSPHQQISPAQLLCGHLLLPPPPFLTHGSYWATLLHLYNSVISRMLHKSSHTARDLLPLASSSVQRPWEAVQSFLLLRCIPL